MYQLFCWRALESRLGALVIAIIFVISGKKSAPNVCWKDLESGLKTLSLFFVYYISSIKHVLMCCLNRSIEEPLVNNRHSKST